MTRKVGEVGKMSPEIAVKREKLLTGGVPSGKKGSIVLHVGTPSIRHCVIWRLEVTKRAQISKL
jgi:hypothetical protein